MTMQTMAGSAGGVLKVAGSLDLSAASALRDSLRDWMRVQPELRLDLLEVEACDTSALQVLCAARKSALKLGKPFLVVAVSAAVLEASAALGLPLEDPITQGDGDGI